MWDAQFLIRSEVDFYVTADDVQSSQPDSMLAVRHALNLILGSMRLGNNSRIDRSFCQRRGWKIRRFRTSSNRTESVVTLRLSLALISLPVTRVAAPSNFPTRDASPPS